MYSSTQIDASNFVEGVDRAFLIILGFSFVFLIVLTFLMVYFSIRYNKKRHPKAVQIHGNVKLEIAWTVGAVLLVLLLFYFGWAGWKPMKNPPPDARRVTATARMWQFQFTYANGRVMDTLILPVNQPVVLDLVALDVIHSLYIPAFRIKEDLVPGDKKEMWFKPQREGEYDLFCAEYCGLQHSYMNSVVQVISEEDFNKWITDSTAMAPPKDLPPWQAGFNVLKKNGCLVCHSQDGSKLVGPSYKGIYGHTAQVTSGGTDREIIVDEEYIKRSIYDPNADVVKGYNKGLMLSYEGLISDEEIDLVLEYLKHLAE